MGENAVCAIVRDSGTINTTNKAPRRELTQNTGAQCTEEPQVEQL